MTRQSEAAAPTQVPHEQLAELQRLIDAHAQAKWDMAYAFVDDGIPSPEQMQAVHRTDRKVGEWMVRHGYDYRRAEEERP
ncbi:hypothetical protein ABZV93_12050 [Actinopolymorpha sp. NPDC004070]|uniref:hypothetical protein n=1 Tax=Actinopolymorpha sp. NPDC004070 TaxID=3154548 RepID=UPI0033B34D3B